MKDYAKTFYKSRAWQKCRSAYAKSRGYLCERCLKNGIVKPGEMVHHRIYVTPDNIKDPSITLNFDNLELLCRECHEAEHRGFVKRFSVDEFGRISPLS